MTGPAFDLEVYDGTAGAFHALDLLVAPRPRVVVCRASAPALVLGSGQSWEVVDRAACNAAGVEVVRRRSGGGAVFVDPSSVSWFDVVVPARDRRFAAVAGDVGASMRWLGAAIEQALHTLGVADLRVQGTTSAGAPWSSLLCFAGLGPGEVVHAAAGKLVGISQRRNRSGARFQCMVHSGWSPPSFLPLLAPPRPTTDELPVVAVLAAGVARGLPTAVAAALTSLP